MYVGVHRKGRLLDLPGTKESPGLEDMPGLFQVVEY